MNLQDYVIRILIIGQPLLWIYLLRFKKLDFVFELISPLFLLLSFIVLTYVGINDISIHFYSNNILIIYIVFVIFSFLCLQFKFNAKESWCLSFLIVYMNSLYWELSLHSIALLHGEIFNTLFQIGSHSYFIPLLSQYIEIKNGIYNLKLLLKGLIVSTLIVFIWGTYLVIRIYIWKNYRILLPRKELVFYVNNLIRFLSLLFIVKTFICGIKIRD